MVVVWFFLTWRFCFGFVVIVVVFSNSWKITKCWPFALGSLPLCYIIVVLHKKTTAKGTQHKEKTTGPGKNFASPSSSAFLASSLIAMSRNLGRTALKKSPGKKLEYFFLRVFPFLYVGKRGKRYVGKINCHLVDVS